MKISEIVDRKGNALAVLGEDDPLALAVATMEREKIGSVAITGNDGNRIVGLLSQGELIGALARLGSEALSRPAGDFMYRNMLYCRCSDDVALVMDRMTSRKQRHSVVQHADGRVVGIVSLGDLVASLLASARLETDVLRDMARSHICMSSA